jgi:hypothetical protein
MTKGSPLELMEAFVRGDDLSLDLAGKIEVGLEDIFEDQATFSELSPGASLVSPGWRAIPLRRGADLLDDEARSQRNEGSAARRLGNQVNSNLDYFRDR